MKIIHVKAQKVCNFAIKYPRNPDCTVFALPTSIKTEKEGHAHARRSQMKFQAQ